jgi:hypothetical protein
MGRPCISSAGEYVLFAQHTLNTHTPALFSFGRDLREHVWGRFQEVEEICHHNKTAIFNR